MGNEEKFLIPSSKGLIVRDPRTKDPLPEGGAIKPWIGPEGRYWRRRVACGDCVIKEEKAKAAEPAKSFASPDLFSKNTSGGVDKK